MRKRHVWLTVVVLLVLVIGVGVTVAFLAASSNQVKNTFTVGDVNATLTETTGNTYKLIPGAGIKKDPVVTVIAESETCWLFVKIEKSGNFDTFCTYEIDSEWHELPSHIGVFYRMVERASVDQQFHVLKNDSISVRELLTENQLSAITKNPTLKFTAYAIQSDGFATVHDAWQALEQ